jgi:RNA ligase (TIGR02306 family)
MPTVEPDRVMAQVVKVLALETMYTPKENKPADSIELASVLGWKVVVKKGEFKVNDLAIYFTIGSVLPDSCEHMKFLEKKPLKTKKIMNIVSQGLLGNLNWLKAFNCDPDKYKEGDDVTKELQVRKFIHDSESDEYKNVDATNFPNYVPKTDETRGQSCLRIISEIIGYLIVITLKMDGTSTTFIHTKDKFMMCGRNKILTEQDVSNKHYFDIEKKYDISSKMKELNRNIAIQGETCGPKINCNRIKMKEIDFYVFNIFDIDTQNYLPWSDVLDITNKLGLKTVPVIYRGIAEKEWNLNYYVNLAEKQEYSAGIKAEGIVIKTDYHPDVYPRSSFKIISPKYELKHDL